MSDPTSHSELVEQLTLLKDQYVKLFNERDVLLDWLEPELNALYTSKIGTWLIKRLKVQLRVKSLQLKIERVTSCVNRLEPVDVASIEVEVASIMAEAEQHIMTQTKKLELSNHLLKNLVSLETSNSLRKLYCEFAKKLHPDVNDLLTKELTDLWLIVKRAYEVGDIEKLEALKIVYEKQLGDADHGQESLQRSELLYKVNKLKEGIKFLLEEITAIKACFPFTIERQIRDEEWVQNETASIRKDVDHLIMYEQQLMEEYNKLLAKI